MKLASFCAAAILITVPALAAEKVAGSNYYNRDPAAYPTGSKSGYWTITNTGVSRSSAGPLGNAPVECHGVGWWDENGAWGEGVCTHRMGDDVRWSKWTQIKGQSGGTWEFIGGAGKWAGIEGGGTWIGNRLSNDYGFIDWEGEMTLPE